jgi:hypothetical protein
MRQMISGLIAAVAVMTAGPAMACGFDPCQTYAPPVSYSGCGACGGAVVAYPRLAEPTSQYYYVNQGPTYSGPAAFAPYPTYQESAVPAYSHHAYDGYQDGGYATGTRYYGAGVVAPAYGYGWHRPYRAWHHAYRYGYAPRHYGYGPRYGYAPHYGYGPRYGYAPRHYGYPVLRRYY